MARGQTNCLLMARNAGSDHRRAADQRNRTTWEGHRGVRPADKGYLFPWRAGQVIDQDPLNARCHVGVDLQPDDIIFGFYYHVERDFLYRGVDVNPFSNPEVRDRVVRFFYKAGHPTRTIYHELINADGSVHSTSDPDPESGTRHDIGQLAVGFSVGEDEIRTKNIRVRGGGLAAEHHGIPQALHMWDLGYWDGKPYPLGGSAVIHLPLSVFGRFTRVEMAPAGFLVHFAP
jgi:hypothetical protein